jgi:hypothetical protein
VLETWDVRAACCEGTETLWSGEIPVRRWTQDPARNRFKVSSNPVVDASHSKSLPEEVV